MTTLSLLEDCPGKVTREIHPRGLLDGSHVKEEPILQLVYGLSFQVYTKAFHGEVSRTDNAYETLPKHEVVYDRQEIHTVFTMTRIRARESASGHSRRSGNLLDPDLTSRTTVKNNSFVMNSDYRRVKITTQYR